MKHTPPPLVLLASAVLSIRKTEKLTDGVTAVSGTEGVSHVSAKQRMSQSLMSYWKLILALRSSMRSSMRPRNVSPVPQSFADSSVFPTVLLDPSSPGVIQVAIVLLHVSEESPMATLDTWIKCPEAG